MIKIVLHKIKTLIIIEILEIIEMVIIEVAMIIGIVRIESHLEIILDLIKMVILEIENLLMLKMEIKRILLKSQINLLIEQVQEIMQGINLVQFLLKRLKKKIEEIILQKLLINKKLLEIVMIIRKLNLKKEWKKNLIKVN